MSEEWSDKFVSDAADYLITQCAYCRHLAGGDAPVAACKAFPGKIPQAILSNEHDHRQPYLIDGEPADVGIYGDDSILFEARPGLPPQVLPRLFAHFAAKK